MEGSTYVDVGVGIARGSHTANNDEDCIFVPEQPPAAAAGVNGAGLADGPKETVFGMENDGRMKGGTDPTGRIHGMPNSSNNYGPCPMPVTGHPRGNDISNGLVQALLHGSNLLSRVIYSITPDCGNSIWPHQFVHSGSNAACGSNKPSMAAYETRNNSRHTTNAAANTAASASTANAADISTSSFRDNRNSIYDTTDDDLPLSPEYGNETGPISSDSDSDSGESNEGFVASSNMGQECLPNTDIADAACRCHADVSGGIGNTHSLSPTITNSKNVTNEEQVFQYHDPIRNDTIQSPECATGITYDGFDVTGRGAYGPSAFSLIPLPDDSTQTSTQLIAGYIPLYYTCHDVCRLFSCYGRVLAACVMYGQNREVAYGLARYATEEEASVGKEHLNNKILDGYILEVKYLGQAEVNAQVSSGPIIQIYKDNWDMLEDSFRLASILRQMSGIPLQHQPTDPLPSLNGISSTIPQYFPGYDPSGHQTTNLQLLHQPMCHSSQVVAPLKPEARRPSPEVCSGM